MFLVFKKKTLIVAGAFLLAAVLVGVAVTVAVSPIADTGIPKKNLTVVIDAGHGGIDGGVAGVSAKVKESDLNLAVTKKLEKHFKGYGVDAVLTRKDKNGLYGISSKGRKKRDMEKRKQIIGEANPNLVISVHMNSFPAQRKQRGAQVFYDKHNEAGKALAQSIQLFLSKNIPHSDRVTMQGEYYILECTDKPAVIVECGFLSNSEDEALLITAEHQEKLAYSIFCGAIAFLEF